MGLGKYFQRFLLVFMLIVLLFGYVFFHLRGLVFLCFVSSFGFAFVVCLDWLGSRDVHRGRFRSVSFTHFLWVPDC